MRCVYSRSRLALLAAAALLGLGALCSAQEDCPPETACQSSPESAVCSGRGRCICGHCSCDQGTTGPFCECDDRSCPRDPSGRMCGGPGRGRCRCGHCLCQPGWLGEACSCSMEVDSCVPPGGGLPCSGRGSCVCGQCECDRPHLSGQFCECDDQSCPRHAGRLCGGEERGACLCGQCACLPGWQGDACECSRSNHTCVDPGSGRVCNRKGICECGSCRCIQEYMGHYCQDCPTCVGQCSSYKSCVECLAFNMGPLKDHCQSACGRMEVELEDQPTVSSSGERKCVFFTNDCRYSFVYGSGIPVRVQRRPTCPQTALRPGIEWLNSGTSSISSGVGTLAVALYSVIFWLQ